MSLLKRINSPFEPPLDADKLGKLLKWLSETSPRDRTPLARVKGLDLSEMLVMLPAMLDHANSKVRLGAIRALGMIGSMAHTELLLSLQDSADPAMSIEAMRALAVLNTPGALERLHLRLADPDPKVRLAALNALVAVDVPQLMSTLIGVLHDPDPELVKTAIDHISARYLLEAADELISLFHEHPDSRVRRCCIEALGKLQDERGDLVRLAAMKDPDAYVRLSAVATIGDLADVEIQQHFIGPLLGLLTRDPDIEVRRLVTGRLSAVPGDTGANAVTTALADPEPRVRMVALINAGQMRLAQAVAAIVALFDEMDDPRYASHYVDGFIGEVMYPGRFEDAWWTWPRHEVIHSLELIGTPDSLAAAHDLRARLADLAEDESP